MDRITQIMNQVRTCQEFGIYAPNRSTLLLRILTRLGLSRGVLCKWVRKQWKKKGLKIVDAQIRGIRYRLQIQANVTDEKILTSSKLYDRVEITEIASLLNKIPRRPDQDTVFVDIGANTGYYSLCMAQRGYKKIIAIEPNPLSLECLRYNIQINPFGSRITVVPLCVGEAGKSSFYCSGGLGDAGLLKRDPNSKAIMVDSAPLSDILRKYNISHINALKIDIEGFEDRALMPFFETTPESLWPALIVIEVCHHTLWKQNIIQMLKECGYNLIRKTRANRILIRK